MAGDRTGYRHFYPQIVNFTEADAKNTFEQGVPSNSDPEDYAAYLHNLAADAERIQSGVTLVPWLEAKSKASSERSSNSLLVERSKAVVVENCVFRLMQVSNLPETQAELSVLLPTLGLNLDEIRSAAASDSLQITPEELFGLEMINKNWRQGLITNPVHRMKAAKNWHLPFDALDPSLLDYSLPVLDDHLEGMHSLILRGHGWFGVGEWAMANRNYLNAMAIALGTNNIPSVESLTHFLVETYVAAGDVLSAGGLAEDLLQSPNYRRNPLSVVPLQICETVILGYALTGQWLNVSHWIAVTQTLFGMGLNLNIEAWNSHELLAEVYSYRQDQAAIGRLRTAEAKLLSHMRGSAQHESVPTPSKPVIPKTQPGSNIKKPWQFWRH
jgi:hypothetical protein